MWFFCFVHCPLITFNYHFVFRGNVTFFLKKEFIHLTSDYKKLSANPTSSDMLPYFSKI